MNKIEEFFEEVKKSEEMILATSAFGDVMMRVVSPVYYNGKILFFTNKESNKYKQLEKNPNCCVTINKIYAQCKATLCGSTMLNENEDKRLEYQKKFQGAFEEGLEFAGRDADFVLLTVNNLSGWNYEVNKEAGIVFPTTPFAIKL